MLSTSNWMGYNSTWGMGVFMLMLIVMLYLAFT